MTNTKFNRNTCRPRVSGVQFRKSPLTTIIDDFFNGELFGPELQKAKKTVFNSLATYPAVNIKETDDAFHLDLIVPGFEKNAFEIALEADQLTVKSKRETSLTTENTNIETNKDTGETVGETEELEVAKPKVKFLRKEYNARYFSKTFTLPENVNVENINANYENGVLSILLPKSEVEPKVTRTITVS